MNSSTAVGQQGINGIPEELTQKCLAAQLIEALEYSKH